MTMATRLMAANIETANNDAEGGRRDWEEDPLGFDTNPMLLRAMCMAFEYMWLLRTFPEEDC